MPGRASTAGRDSGPSTARFSYRAGPGTIKRAVLRAGPLGTAHLAIYSLHQEIMVRQQSKLEITYPHVIGEDFTCPKRYCPL